MFKQYLKVVPVKNGNGVITTVQIPSGVPIVELGGDIFTSQTMPDPSVAIQIGTDLFLGASGGTDDFLNHSCVPNCSLQVLGKRAILYSLYVIAEGSELTFDYSTTSTDTLDTWKMDCNCGEYACRKVISGLQYLSSEQIKEYTDKRMLPLYLTNPVFK